METSKNQLYQISFDIIVKQDIRKLLNNKISDILEVSMFLNKIRFTGALKRYDFDHQIKSHLYPAFAALYQPHFTTGFGNCLWNMVSLSLCGNESLMKSLRFLTVVGMLLLKTDFLKIINQRYEHFEKDNIEMRTQLKFEKLLRDAFEDGCWGNEFHLLALATVLGRKIFIYSYFTKSGEFLLEKNIDVNELLLEFKKKPSKVGHHLQYEPIQNDFFPKLAFDSLNGFICTKSAHYTALIPLESSVPVFIPQTNLFN